MNTIYLALSTALVLLFSFIFYKTRDTPISGVQVTSESLFFTTPIKAIVKQNNLAQSYCAGGCSWTETAVGYGEPGPYSSDTGSGTLPYDLQKQDGLDTMPFDMSTLAAGQSATPPSQSFTFTSDPIVSLIPDQTIY